MSNDVSQKTIRAPSAVPDLNSDKLQNSKVEQPATCPECSDRVARRHRPIRMLRLAQVLEVTGLGKTKIYDLQAMGQFPMRVKITAHSVAWIEEEVQAWLTARIEERR